VTSARYESVAEGGVGRPGRRASRAGGHTGRRLAAAVIVGAAAVVGAYVVYGSATAGPWRLGGYTVRGASYMTAAEVLAAAGLAPGDNLFRIDGEAARRRLCRSPRVRGATVRRRLPAEVVIMVEERPTVAAAVINGELYKVAGDGVVLEAMAAGYEDVPVLVGERYRVRGAVAGKRLARAEVAAALGALDALAVVDRPWLAAVDYVDVNEGVIVLAAGRRRVRYGPTFDERTARRLLRVYELTTAAGGSGVVTYDVRFGADVIVTGATAPGGNAGGGKEDDGEV